MSARVVCAGGAVRDLTFRVHGDPVLGTSNPATLASSSGGVARNVAEYLAALGCAVAMVTAVGADDAGREIVRSLEQAGVGTEHVRAVPGESTAQYAAVIDPAGELTIGLAVMEVLDRIGTDWLDDAWPTDGGWLFCDTNLQPRVLTHAIARAAREGTPLVVDAVSTPKVTRLPSRLDGITLLSCNADEARSWSAHHGLRPSGGPEHLAQQLIDAGASAVLITLGAGGVVAADAQGVEHIPVPPIEVADVTGAGDALIAAATAALIGGSSLGEAAQAGTRLAARVLSRPGSALN